MHVADLTPLANNDHVFLNLSLFLLSSATTVRSPVGRRWTLVFEAEAMDAYALPTRPSQDFRAHASSAAGASPGISNSYLSLSH